MSSFILSPAQQEELSERLKKEKSVKIHRRLKFIRYKAKGLSHRDIAPVLDVCNDTLTDWLSLFLDSGFEGLCGLRYEGRRFSRLEPVKDAIKKQVESGNVPTVLALSDWIMKTHGITIQESGLFKFLKKNFLVLTKRPA